MTRIIFLILSNIIIISCNISYDDGIVVWYENNEKIISSVNSNLYVEYIYPAYHIDLKEKLYAPEGNVNLKENILCGYNYGKCEVIFKDNFEEYLSTSEGRYILINRRLNKNKFSILS